MIRLLGVCTTERSNDSFTILSPLLKSFLRILFTWLSPTTTTLRPFLIILAQLLLPETVKGINFSGNSRRYIQGVFYFTQYQLHGEMCFYYQLDFLRYIGIVLVVFLLLSFDHRQNSCRIRIQFEVNVIRFSVSFKSIFSRICRVTMLISGSRNLPMNFAFGIVRFVIYIHIILVTESSQCLFSNLDRFSTRTFYINLLVFNNFELDLDVTFNVTIFIF